jgi:RNA-splicing ligase RtcB
MDDPERPGPDANAAEIAEWMEEDFGRAVAEGIENAGDEDDPNDEHEVVEVEILNHERGEVVGTVDTDGNLDTESEALREVSKEYLEEGVPVLVPTTYENEDGETVHADAEMMVEPGATGFVRAFVDELPSPFDCDSETLADLPVHDEE